mgnify:CR=1 FL=1
MATSGVDRSDRNPEDAYDVDLRRIDPEDRSELRRGGINKSQGRVEKAMRAMKAAGRYRMGTAYNQPLREDGQPYERGGSKLYSDLEIPVPGYGDKFGTQGGYGYAEKPKQPTLMFGFD